jgi:putative ABC transport system permease protein
MGLPLDYALTSLARKPLRTTLCGVSCGLATLLVLGALAFTEALERSFTRLGREDVAIVLSASAENDPIRSEIAPAIAAEIAAGVPGIARASGVAMVSAEVTMGLDVSVAAAATPRPALLRGVDDAAFLLHPEVQIVEGRPPAGAEAILGRFAERRLGLADGSLAIGQTLAIDGHSFTICGRFVAPGSAFEAEIWTGRESLMAAARRDTYSCVFAKLVSKDAFGHLQLFAQRRLDLEVEALRTSEFYASVAAFFAPIRDLALAMAVLIAGAAFLTSATTLSAAVRERAVEIATLRTIGYSRVAVAVAIATESLAIGAIGSLIAAVIARASFADLSVAVAMGEVGLSLSSRTLATGLLFGLLLSQVAVIPALHARLRRDLATELRQD